MRLFKIAQRRELGELISYRCAAAAKSRDACDDLASDRLCRLYILIDQCAEYFLFSFAYTHFALKPLVCWHSSPSSANIPPSSKLVKAFIKNFAQKFIYFFEQKSRDATLYISTNPLHLRHRCIRTGEVNHGFIYTSLPQRYNEYRRKVLKNFDCR